MVDNRLLQVELDKESTEISKSKGYMVQHSVLCFKTGWSFNTAHRLNVTYRESKYLESERLVLSTDMIENGPNHGAVQEAEIYGQLV